MAVKSIAQTRPECKRANDANLPRIIHALEGKICKHHNLSARVLKQSNEDAKKLLSMVFFERIIPGTDYAEVHNVAEFYGIEKDRMTCLLRAVGINTQVAPLECVFAKTSKFLELCVDAYEIVESSRRRLRFRIEGMEFSLPAQTTFLSARMILALAPLIDRYKGGQDGTAHRITQFLMNSPFNREPEREESIIPTGFSARSEANTITMTVDDFARIVATAVKTAFYESGYVAVSEINHGKPQPMRRTHKYTA